MNSLSYGTPGMLPPGVLAGQQLGPQGYDPYGQYQQQDLGGQLAPQGFIGDAIGQIAGPVGGWIGGRFGNRNLGQQVGGIAGQLGRLLPFEAGPQGYDPYTQYQQQQNLGGQLAPQGFFGDAIGQIAGPVGGWIGGRFGNRNLGQQVGGIAGQLGRLLPFEAGPQGYDPYGQYQQQQDLSGQLAPQGFFGDAIGQIAGPVGGWIGGRLGNRNLGQQVGGIAGQLGRLLPFEAGPQGYDPYGQYQQQQDLSGQLAPQGFIGDAIGQIAGPVGGWIGGRFGNRNLGQQVGGIAGQLGRLLPFEAGPQGYDPYLQYQQQQDLSGQLAPQGFFGDAIGQIAGPVGGWIGGRFGNRNLGQQVGGIAGQLGRLLPFEAGPQGYGNPYAYQQQQQQDAGGQLAPQGFFGGLAGSVLGGLGGGAIGKAFGNRNLGRNIGRGVGGALGAILPFDASPQYGQQAQAYQNYGGQQGWYPAGYQGQQG